MISKEIPGSITLGEYFSFVGADRRIRPFAIRKVAQAIKKMHEARIHHNDLNLKNILVQKNGEIKIFILDFDKSKMKKLSLRDRIKNLARFNRSREKLGVNFNEEEKKIFFDAYFGDEKDLRYFKKCFSYPMLHKIFWKF